MTTSPPDEALAAALDAVRRAPDKHALWDRLEDLATAAQRPDEVAELYRETLSADLPKDLALAIGRRAAQWHEEWLGETAPELTEVLERVFAIDSNAEWAFQRLTVLYAAQARWDRLLALYDRAIESVAGGPRRAALLDEAARIAKDFAGDTDRAIRYLGALSALRPEDSGLAASLERLLEKHGRWTELIALWRGRLERLARPEAFAVRRRIALCLLEAVGDARAALDELERALGDGDGSEQTVALLERISQSRDAPAEVRREALALLRARYEADGRQTDVVRALGTAIELADRKESVKLHREAGERLLAQERVLEAHEHFAAVLRLDPGARDARERLREIAARTGDALRHVEALERAAEVASGPELRTSLLLEAAEIRRGPLGDRDGAIGLLRRVLAVDGAHPIEALVPACRRLAVLYAETDRHEERLEVLERLASIEPEEPDRRAALSAAARLAASIGRVERAIALWESRLERDRDDLEAHTARIELCERLGDEGRLVDALLARASVTTVPAVVARADLARAARGLAERLGDVPGAIRVRMEMRERFGPDSGEDEALAGLLERAGRDEEAAALLESTASRERDRVAELHARLGGLYARQPSRTEEAVAAFVEALRLDPDRTEALEGLQSIAEQPSVRARALDALAEAHERRGRWDAWRALVDARLEVRSDPADRVALLRRAAHVEREHGAGPAQALRRLAQALPLAPADEVLEAQLWSLAEDVPGRRVALEAVRQAAAALEASGTDPIALRRLWRRDAEESARDGLDPAGAVRAWQRLHGLDPARPDVAEALVAAALDAGEPHVAAQALVATAVAGARLDSSLVDAFERRAVAQGLAEPAVEALEAALASVSSFPPRLGRELYAWVARWWEERVGDLERARAALWRAVGHEPDHAPSWRALVEMSRGRPERRLVDAWVRIADLSDDTLPALAEAAAQARSVGDETARAEVERRLWREATRAARSAAASGDFGAARQACRHALEVLEAEVDRRMHAADASGAVALLEEAAELPIEGEQRAALLERAATLAREHGDLARAIALHRALLTGGPQDVERLERIAELCEQAGRVEELVDVRRRQVELAPDGPARFRARLALARAAGELERRAGRVEALLDNLAESPGHEETLAALEPLLRERGQLRRLQDVLVEQAERLEAIDPARAAQMHARLAGMRERDLGDVLGAIASWRRVLALGADRSLVVAAHDALARLHGSRGEHVEAAASLGRLLELVSEAEATEVRLRLAEVHVATGALQQAAAVLEAAFRQAPADARVRERLGALYRAAGRHDALVALFAASVAHLDAGALLEAAREAAAWCGSQGTYGIALELFEAAARLEASDRSLQLAYARALSEHGRYDEAESVLRALLERFGRRRNPERAAVHVEIARLARARGRLDEALDELDVAIGMDVGNPATLSLLGSLAHQAGQLDRAERAYRALLVVLRRQGETARGQAAVLYALHRIAASRGHDEQAAELLASALEAAAGDDEETRALVASALQLADAPLALRAIEARLARTTSEQARAAWLWEAVAVLADAMDRPDEALERALQALACDLADPRAHARCRALARRAGGTQRYVAALEEAVKRVRRTDLALASDLLLRAATVLHEDEGATEAAA
ncbi:MAG: tetratricopeptide repeat protein, partial [Myxococcota bacterium]|nr:tetratricopeptide repeat protein [Myxococcota bacterium]